MTGPEFNKHWAVLTGRAQTQAAPSQVAPPDPDSARTPEEFVAKMRQAKAYYGLTLRDASARAGTLGELPKSSLHDALKAKSLPKPALLRHFLTACGLTEDEIAVWESVRRRIAMEQAS